MPPRAWGLTRNPWPYFPVWNASVGLISTMLAEPRSWSVPHQWFCQSCGTKKSSWAMVAESLTIASFSYVGVPSPLALQPKDVPLPEVSNTLPVLSSTTTPPALQNPAPCPGVWYQLLTGAPLVGTATT